MSLLSPISNKIQEITEFREKNRRSEYFNHLSAISESIAALGKNHPVENKPKSTHREIKLFPKVL